MEKEMYERVNNGIEFLNSYFGILDAWINRVDLEKLDMHSLSDCIVGQIFGYYKYSLWCSEEDIEYCSGHPYGFDDSSGRYTELTEAWIVVLSNLRTTL